MATSFFFIFFFISIKYKRDNNKKSNYWYHILPFAIFASVIRYQELALSSFFACKFLVSIKKYKFFFEFCISHSVLYTFGWLALIVIAVDVKLSAHIFFFIFSSTTCTKHVSCAIFLWYWRRNLNSISLHSIKLSKLDEENKTITNKSPFFFIVLKGSSKSFHFPFE